MARERCLDHLRPVPFLYWLMSDRGQPLDRRAERVQADVVISDRGRSKGFHVRKPVRESMSRARTLRVNRRPRRERIHLKKPFANGLIAVSTAVLFDATAMAQPSIDCAELRLYFEARAASNQQTPQQVQAFTAEWLPRLLAHVNDPGCGVGTDSAAWHAMTLANLCEQWTLARSLAADGVRAATNPAERALWQMNVAGAAFHGINPADNTTIHAAMDELDRFLVLAPGMDAASQPGAEPASLVPSVNALVWKADCQRRLGDRIGAACTEQRVATTFVAAGVPVDASFGGFLPEEAFFRAAIDYASVDRPADAAACLATIRLMPSPARPAGQHAWNAAASLATARQARHLVQETLRQLPLDEWAVLQVYEVAGRTPGSEADAADRQEAIALVNQALAGGEANMHAAGVALARVQQQAGRGPGPDQEAGFHARLLRERAKLEFDAADLNGARATLTDLASRGWLMEWTNVMLERVTSRERAAGVR